MGISTKDYSSYVDTALPDIWCYNTPLACSVFWLAETRSRGMNYYSLVIARAFCGHWSLKIVPGSLDLNRERQLQNFLSFPDFSFFFTFKTELC